MCTVATTGKACKRKDAGKPKRCCNAFCFYLRDKASSVHSSNAVTILGDVYIVAAIITNHMKSCQENNCLNVFFCYFALLCACRVCGILPWNKLHVASEWNTVACLSHFVASKLHRYINSIFVTLAEFAQLRIGGQICYILQQPQLLNWPGLVSRWVPTSVLERLKTDV